MIKVHIEKKDSKISYIEVKGHSNSAPHGEDLICAGVSSVVTGCLNSLKHVDQFRIVYEEGLVEIEYVGKSQISEHDQVVLETLITSLKTIQEVNPKYIRVNEN